MPRTRRKTAALALVPALALATLLTSSPAAAASSAAQRQQVRHHKALPSWQLKPVDSTEQFRGLDAVSRSVAWVGGSNGSIFRTVDGGDTWANVSPLGSTGLLFRDVEAFGRNRAVVLAIGEADASRVYRTDDGGQTWTQTFTNPDPAAFYDCMAFSSDHRHGLAVSDPVDGKFRIIATNNGGRSWKVRSSAGMPDALPGEFGFAASGTCLTTFGTHDAWFGTGGGAQGRVFHSRDNGKNWTVAATPVVSTSPDGGGIFSVAFRDRRHGFAIGGAAFDPASGGFDSVECAGDGSCWASQQNGKVARLKFH